MPDNCPRDPARERGVRHVEQAGRLQLCQNGEFVVSLLHRDLHKGPQGHAAFRRHTAGARRRPQAAADIHTHHTHAHARSINRLGEAMAAATGQGPVVGEAVTDVLGGGGESRGHIAAGTGNGSIMAAVEVWAVGTSSYEALKVGLGVDTCASC